MTSIIQPPSPTDLCIVVVTYNSAEDLPGFVASLHSASGGLSHRVVVVDNCSSDATVEIAEGLGLQCIRAGSNRGYAAGINMGRAEAMGAGALLFSNPDVRFAPDSIRILFEACTKAGTVCVPRILDERGDLVPSLRREPTLGGQMGEALFGDRLARRPRVFGIMIRDRGYYEVSHEVEWATGAVLMVPAECDQAVGPWSEAYFLYSEEVDFCRRVRAAGFGIKYIADAIVCHAEGGSGRSADLVGLEAVNRLRYFRQWHGLPASYSYAVLVVVEKVLRSRDAAQRRAAQSVIRCLGRELARGQLPDGSAVLERMHHVSVGVDSPPS